MSLSCLNYLEAYFKNNLFDLPRTILVQIKLFLNSKFLLKNKEEHA